MKRILRPSIQYFIETISIFILIILACVNDFEWNALPFIFGMVIVLILNCFILKKYGK